MRRKRKSSPNCQLSKSTKISKTKEPGRVGGEREREGGSDWPGALSSCMAGAMCLLEIAISEVNVLALKA